MEIPLDEVIHWDVITSDPSTGDVSDADSTPTFEVFEEATDTDIGVGGNLTKRTSKTGNYRGTFTLSAANGFEVGKWYNVVCSAAVGGVAGKVVAKNFRVVAAESIAGTPKADMSALGGAAQSATDLKDFADTGYDPSTHKVSGVALADVLTTYTGNTPQTGDAYAVANTMNETVDVLRGSLVAFYGTNTSSSSNTIVFDSSADSTDDVYNGMWVYVISGTNDKQARLIVDYVGSTRTATVSPVWNGNPSASSGVAIIPAAYVAGVYGDTPQTADHASNISAIKAKTDNLPSDPADASDIASSFSTVNSTLSTIAGYIDTEVAAIKTVTDGLNTLLSTTGVALTAAERNAIADAHIGRNIAGGSSTGRLVKDVYARLRNRSAVSGGTFTVYSTDDTTSLWTATLTTDAAAEPVVDMDPA